VLRVVATARRLARLEGARLDVVLPAAWLHDCVVLPKDSPRRAQASRLAAEKAVAFLKESGYRPDCLEPIGHAIEAHSFSAQIRPQTIEARVVQDADRLDAIGAIGVARCLMLGAMMDTPLYDADEPFPTSRAPDDRVAIIDHFYTKLLKLNELMNTAAARSEANRRTRFMNVFLEQLRDELADLPDLAVKL
jgi:uncharacterized protein